jgi:hypothetical protein
MGLVKKGADFRVAEHQLVLAVSDRCAARLQRGYSGLDNLNGFVAKCFRHGVLARLIYALDGASME